MFDPYVIRATATTTTKLLGKKQRVRGKFLTSGQEIDLTQFDLEDKFTLDIINSFIEDSRRG